ncbi:MAG TPA: type II secretion system minor pseudopilin GspH [Steroidobacteraceae bacterium]|nr:type II secretion system minor pseudopilin GspH [Steroidobacteraceae bacterium]
MRSSGPARRLGAPHRTRSGGFTLLEIMVVVLIIGVVTAGVVLSINFAGKDTALETESQRLLSLMKYARDQAELQTRNYGIAFSQHGYEFVVYDVRQGVWRPVSEDEVLRERTLPNGLGFKLVVDARPIVLSDSLEVPSGSSSSDSASSSKPHTRPVPPTGARAGSDSDSDSNSDSDSDSDSGARSFAPQVMIFSSGDLSSFSITLARESAGRSITLDENQDGDIVEKPIRESGT